MSARALLRCLFSCLGLWLLAAGWSMAADDADIRAQRAELEKLRARIAAAGDALNEAATAHATEVAALARAERAVSRAQRRLREVEAQRVVLAREAIGLAAAVLRAGERVDEGQRQLARWLRHTYVHNRFGAAAAVFRNEDSGALQRDLVYLERIGRAHQQGIDALRADLAHQEHLMQVMAAQRERIQALEARLQAEEQAVQQAVAQRKAKVEALAGVLGSRRDEARALREDEARMALLLRELERQAQQVREAAVPQRPVAVPPPGTDAPEPSPPVRSAVLAPPAPGPTPGSVSFAQLQGQLGLPVRGELVGRFGAPRAEGGTTWRGVFIRARQGAEVKAVAAGEVVFSDWLRGFGNLLILDHGNDYLSVYGNNDALLREVGDKVDGGATLASVGASGNQGESGLYFEIRHQGRPVDPLRWVRR